MADLDFNEMFDMTFFENLPDDLKKAVENAGFELDEKGFVIDKEGKDVSYTQLMALAKSPETQIHEFKINGIECREFTVKSRSNTSAGINVPSSWQGKRVMVVRLE